MGGPVRYCLSSGNILTLWADGNNLVKSVCPHLVDTTAPQFVILWKNLEQSDILVLACLSFLTVNWQLEKCMYFFLLQN